MVARSTGRSNFVGWVGPRLFVSLNMIYACNLMIIYKFKFHVLNHYNVILLEFAILYKNILVY
ncbi:hypothetical protein C2G38_2114741 [Gigaspora rosea]|uniref:Uncharacterized protein n=1 Tax=Gigaspora rosea TaxID=44941 RepID=A0A397UIB0_9GLOM|nr:hypothetical protein C2G38_2114741 [Gigaspora rosea]